MASESTIARLLIDIGVDADDAKKAAKEITGELDKTETKAKTLGDTLKTVGKVFAAVAGAITAAAGTVFAFTNRITQTGDEIGKTAKKVGVGVEELQRLRFAADRSGASSQTLTMALRMQAQFMDQAARGGASEFRAALDSIGLSLEDIQGLGAEERFKVMADRINGLKDPAQRTAVAMGLFGARSGAELVPLLAEGSAGIKALGDEAERLGLVMSEQGVASSEKFQDALTDAKGIIQGVAQEVGVRLVPVVQKVVERFRDWVKENQGLIRSGIEKFIKGAIGLFETLVSVITFVIDNFGKLVSLFAATQTLKAFSAISAGFAAIGVNASAALGPIGLITTALLALVPIALSAGEAIGDALADAAGYGIINRKTTQGGEVFLGSLADADAAEVRALNKEIANLETQAAQGGGAAIQFARKAALDKAVARKRALEAGEGQATKQLRAQQASNAQAVAGAFTGGVGAGGADAADTAALIASGDLVLDSASNEFTKGRGGRGGKKKDKPKSGVTLGDLSVPGVDLEALAAQTPGANEIEPTVAITIINNNIDFDLAQRISGGDAMSIANDSASKMRKVLDDALLQARRNVQSNVVG